MKFTQSSSKFDMLFSFLFVFHDTFLLLI